MILSGLLNMKYVKVKGYTRSAQKKCAEDHENVYDNVHSKQLSINKNVKKIVFENQIKLRPQKLLKMTA